MNGFEFSACTEQEGLHFLELSEYILVGPKPEFFNIVKSDGFGIFSNFLWNSFNYECQKSRKHRNFHEF